MMQMEDIAMKTDFLELSKAYQDYLQQKDPNTREPCPDIELIMASVLAEVTKRDKARIVSHAANCAKCAQVLKRLLAFSSEIDSSFESEKALCEKKNSRAGAENKALWTWLPKRRPVYVMAGLLCMAIIAFFVIRPMVPSNTRDVASKGQITLVSPVNTSLPLDKIQFRWEKIARARYYIVEVFDVSLKLVWRSDPIFENSADFMPGIQPLAPRGTFYWMVTALMEDDTLSKSKLKEFSIVQ
jgi:hypothetical protein